MVGLLIPRRKFRNCTIILTIKTSDLKFIKSLSRKATQKVVPDHNTDVEQTVAIYDIEINDLENNPIDLSIYRGKYLLFVNVASKCGFTRQYSDLEQLFQRFNDRLMIFGVPCNQFGAQEKGSAAQIKSFCERNYGVSFIMTEKIAVKGEKQHLLYRWLTDKSSNGKLNSSVKWNFQKYLVGPEGELIDVFYSITRPLSSKITKHLN
ncbi:MAG: glutathione peroxidase [Eudoraea sp.]|nr:glutathione peroxidase [Eudoraea sp.]